MLQATSPPSTTPQPGFHFPTSLGASCGVISICVALILPAGFLVMALRQLSYVAGLRFRIFQDIPLKDDYAYAKQGIHPLVSSLLMVSAILLGLGYLPVSFAPFVILAPALHLLYLYVSVQKAKAVRSSLPKPYLHLPFLLPLLCILTGLVALAYFVARVSLAICAGSMGLVFAAISLGYHVNLLYRYISIMVSDLRDPADGDNRLGLPGHVQCWEEIRDGKYHLRVLRSTY